MIDKHLDGNPGAFETRRARQAVGINPDYFLQRFQKFGFHGCCLDFRRSLAGGVAFRKMARTAEAPVTIRVAGMTPQ
jgi:hypothetical protein